MGDHCEWPCPNGFWGSGCQKHCQKCRYCDPVSGTCDNNSQDTSDPSNNKFPKVEFIFFINILKFIKEEK